MPDKPLAGVTVLEYASFVAGPYCAKLLGDMGAEVIKIENPEGGDQARKRGPFANNIPHPERSALFLYLNTSKLGITLNLKAREGKNIFRKLVEAADILVEDQPPDVMESLRLDYEKLSAINPRLIMVSITPFGQTGPYKGYKAYYLNSFHGGGEGYLLPAATEWFDRPPIKAGGYLGEYDSGLSAAVAALGGLYARELYGIGQHIDVSKQEAAIALGRGDLARLLWDGTIESRRTQGIRPGGVIPCKDGYVEIQPARDHMWDSLVQAMGNPEWAKTEALNDRGYRHRHAKEINSHIAEWARNRTKEEATQEIQEKGCAAGEVNTAQDVLYSQELWERGYFVKLNHPEVGEVSYPGVPYSFSKTPGGPDRPAPLLGEHNSLIYCERLGYAKEDLARLGAAGVI